ncbi:hypothetical protein TNCV_4013321 [Trichonephila clavipes]|nr:hypothetical protein TNCV_4013321 [Trichonephila clavipes]
MFLYSDQSDTETTSVEFPGKLSTHLSTHQRDERMSRTCRVWDLCPEPVIECLGTVGVKVFKKGNKKYRAMYAQTYPVKPRQL